VTGEIDETDVMTVGIDLKAVIDEKIAVDGMIGEAVVAVLLEETVTEEMIGTEMEIETEAVEVIGTEIGITAMTSGMTTATAEIETMMVIIGAKMTDETEIGAVTERTETIEDRTGMTGDVMTAIGSKIIEEIAAIGKETTGIEMMSRKSKKSRGSI